MTAISYSADDTALLVVDPYNDFMSEGGKLYERTKETAEAVGFYVDECRNRRLYLSHARAWCKNSVDDVGVDNVHLLSNA